MPSCWCPYINIGLRIMENEYSPGYVLVAVKVVAWYIQSCLAVCFTAV